MRFTSLQLHEVLPFLKSLTVAGMVKKNKLPKNSSIPHIFQILPMISPTCRGRWPPAVSPVPLRPHDVKFLEKMYVIVISC